jgi:hypothetical protein
VIVVERKLVVLDPNSDLIVVAVRFKVVPITVLDWLVPIVTVEFKAAAAGVLIPIPVKLDIVLTSPIVN